jgi:CheY-like chemotaxis protein
MTCCSDVQAIDTTVRKVVLVCDDSKLQLKAMQRALQRYYHIITASSGYEAVAFASLYSPDIIILDIAMYGMSGYEAATKIQHNQLTKNIPIIFVTAHDGDQYRDRGFEVGAVDFVKKPFDLSMLIEIIEKNTHERKPPLNENIPEFPMELIS